MLQPNAIAYINTFEGELGKDIILTIYSPRITLEAHYAGRVSVRNDGQALAQLPCQACEGHPIPDGARIFPSEQEAVSWLVTKASERSFECAPGQPFSPEQGVAEA